MPPPSEVVGQQRFCHASLQPDPFIWFKFKNYKILVPKPAGVSDPIACERRKQGCSTDFDYRVVFRLKFLDDNLSGEHGELRALT